MRSRPSLIRRSSERCPTRTCSPRHAGGSRPRGRRGRARRESAIFGDYDVDGATSAALMARFLRHAGIDPVIHIPDRLFEGYRPEYRGGALSWPDAAPRSWSRVDCGTTSDRAAGGGASALGVDVVVDRPPSGRRGAAARGRHRRSEQARRSLRPRPSRRRRAHLHDTVVAVNRVLRAPAVSRPRPTPEPDLLTLVDDVCARHRRRRGCRLSGSTARSSPRASSRYAAARASGT